MPLTPTPGRLVFALVCSFAAPAAPAAAQGDWTCATAIAELEQLVLTKTPMAEWKARDAKIAAWSERVAASGLDLGDHRFLLGVAKYFAKDVDGASALLLAELTARGGTLPTTKFDMVVGRTLMNRVATAALAKDFAAARQALPHAMRLDPEPSGVAASASA